MVFLLTVPRLFLRCNTLCLCVSYVAGLLFLFTLHFSFFWCLSFGRAVLLDCGISSVSSLRFLSLFVPHPSFMVCLGRVMLHDFGISFTYIVCILPVLVCLHFLLVSLVGYGLCLWLLLDTFHTIISNRAIMSKKLCRIYFYRGKQSNSLSSVLHDYGQIQILCNY